VLASKESESGRITDQALSRALRRLWTSHPKLKHRPELRPHDLRRSHRTFLSALGTPPHIAEKALGHKLGRLEETYDKFDFLPERRAAADKLAAYVERLVSPGESNVAFLPTKAAR
jgi:integrase